jgi:hypothetical protein
MKKLIGNYEFELANDTVYIRDANNGELLKAITYRAYEAVDKFQAICKYWQAKLEQPAF